jgi:hypothetical protein
MIQVLDINKTLHPQHTVILQEAKALRENYEDTTDQLHIQYGI